MYIDASSAVFNVGKVLENAMKRYFMTLVNQRKLLSADGKLLTMSKAPSQNDMVTILVNNQLIADRRLLDILREECNRGAHHLRTREEREELKRTGERYIRWYLYYIFVFEARLAVLNESRLL